MKTDGLLFQTLGHAGVRCVLDGVTLLCDPWLSETGSFLASWHVFPPNDHLPRAPLLAPDLVYVSHIHEDHYDREFLAQVSKTATVLIPSFPDKRLRTQLQELGFRSVVELQSFETFRVSPSVELTIVTKDMPHWHDSALLIRAGDKAVLHQNDCKLSESQVTRVLDTVTQIDVLYNQFSPANWYPMAYHYAADKEQRIKRSEREQWMNVFVRYVELLRPRLVIPFAGPPALLDRSLLPHCLGADSIFPMIPEAVARVDALRAAGRVSTRAETLLPGDTVTLPGMEIERDPHWKGFDFARKDEYLADYARQREKVIAAYLASIREPQPDLYDRFARHMNDLVAAHAYLARRVSMPVLFDIQGPHGGRWLVDFRKDRDVVSRAEPGTYPYAFYIESRFLQAVLDGRLTFDALFLSIRFAAHRDPDLYSEDLMTLLKRDDRESLKLIESHLRGEGKKEYIEIESDGRRYRIEKFCPHAGGNLQRAEVRDGVVTCPVHGWKFRLSDGHCLTARYRSLEVSEVAAERRP
jgi:UDP-MurNAc hydroxylase